MMAAEVPIPDEDAMGAHDVARTQNAAAAMYDVGRIHPAAAADLCLALQGAVAAVRRLDVTAPGRPALAANDVGFCPATATSLGASTATNFRTATAAGFRTSTAATFRFRWTIVLFLRDLNSRLRRRDAGAALAGERTRRRCP